MSRPVRIAVAQYAPTVGDVASNRDAAVSWVRRAGAQGVDHLCRSGKKGNDTRHSYSMSQYMKRSSRSTRSPTL